MVNAMQRIPTFEWHRQKNAVFEDYFGCEVPSHYGNPEQEYWHLRKSAALRDVSFLGKIRVIGRDRQRFLNGMLTNEVKALENGKGAFALFLDVKGHIQADMKVYIFSDHLLLVLQHYLVEKLMAGLDRYIMSEDVRMQDVSAEYAMFQVLGPEAEKTLQEKGIANLPHESYSHSLSGFEIAPDAKIIRLPAGFALLTGLSNGSAILDLLNLPMVGARAFESFRIESGLALMHRDMDETNFPQEARLDAALNFQKGCYLGQETMARIDAQGHVNKQLIGVATTSMPSAGDKIFREGREVGRITSAAHSFLLNQPFAIGYVRREFAREGETIRFGNDNITGIIRQLPLKG